MTREAAINALEHVIMSPVGREEIDETCFEVMKYLAAQEPVKPNEIRHGNVLIHYQCPACTSVLCVVDKYCPECGRAVKWDA